MITVEHLTKRYGNFSAVNDLSFEIGQGHVYGFLGPNGAGKSTTMNIMTGCLSATEGKITIDGHDIYEEPEAAKRLIGYLPEIPPLYVNETPREYLRFVGQAKGLKGSDLYEQIDKVITETGIQKVSDKLISSLSKGYKQRVGIAQALLGNPAVIVLDEPTVGLDPIQIIEIRDLIRKLGEHHTVIFSSHILSEVQAICEKVLIISHGRLVAFDTPEKLEQLFTGKSEIHLVANAPKEIAESILSKVDGITGIESKEDESQNTLLDITTDDRDVRDICGRIFFAFATNNTALYEMTSKKVTLEDVFIELTEKGGGTEGEPDAAPEAGIEMESEVTES